MPRNSKNYTKPQLRAKLKDAIKQSDKGGKPGQWSARKSQLLVQRYEAEGGGYTTDRKDEAAISLERWTEQDWQTIDGEADARTKGRTKRYLPRKVWESLSDDEKREAERTKTTQSMKGKRRVPWTDAIKRAFDRLEQDETKGTTRSKRPTSTSSSARSQDGPTRKELYERARELDVSGRSRMTKAQLQRAIDEAAEGS
ncbi:hypothetical protein [Tautonia rosea]|uniref:hypothetical protein n=1 Tax=Tautonia rosea TaxID=2728037 RepID=UPI0014767DB1|nr:hypothetical protein [Tautonia rosea]